ncbi:predicted protein, partial [Francisella tularensis subsp. novicida GA99-3548]
MSNYSDQDIFF